MVADRPKGTLQMCPRHKADVDVDCPSCLMTQAYNGGVAETMTSVRPMLDMLDAEIADLGGRLSVERARNRELNEMVRNLQSTVRPGEVVEEPYEQAYAEFCASVTGYLCGGADQPRLDTAADMQRFMRAVFANFYQTHWTARRVDVLRAAKP